MNILRILSVFSTWYEKGQWSFYMVIAIVINSFLFIPGCRNENPVSKEIQSQDSTENICESCSVQIAGLAEVTPLLHSLFRDSIPSPTAIAAAIQGVNDVTVAGITDSGVVFVEFGPDKILAAIPTRNLLPPPDTVSPLTLPLTKTSKIPFPEGNSVAIFSGLNGRGYTDWTNEIERLFKNTDCGYENSIKRKFITVDEMRNIKDVSILFIYTHGVLTGYLKPELGWQNELIEYYLTTLEVVPLPYKIGGPHYDDLKKRSLLLCWVPYEALSGIDASKAKTAEPHTWVYGITSRFARENWTFKPNSLAFLCACNSACERAGAIRNVLHDKGVEVVLGWSEPVNGDFARKTSAFFFDCLLGANIAEPKVDQPRRPFGLITTCQAIAEYNLDVWPGDDKHKPSTLMPFSKNPTNDNLLALRPIATTLQLTDFSDSLIITGQFGDNPGDKLVTIKDKPLTILNWTNQRIVCTIGDDDMGPVVVHADGFRSAPIPLTSWNGVFNYSMKGPGKMEILVTMHIHLRGDAHDYRSKPGENIPWRKRRLWMSGKTYATIEGKGSYTEDEVTYSLSGGVTCTAVKNNPGAMFFGGELEGATQNMNIAGLILGAAGVKESINDPELGSYSWDVPVVFTDEFACLGFYDKYFNIPEEDLEGEGAFCVSSQVGSSFVFPSGKIGPFSSTDSPFSAGDGVTVELSWEQITPEYPPDAQTVY